MQTTLPLSTLALTATLMLASSVAAQSGTPVNESPPTGRAPAATAVPRSGSSDVNLTGATNSTGKSSGNNIVRELRFPAVDADANGMISLSEFTTFVEAGNVARSVDSNRGGSEAEALFRQIDTNRDNLLSEKELTTYQDERDKDGSAR